MAQWGKLNKVSMLWLETLVIITSTVSQLKAKGEHIIRKKVCLEENATSKISLASKENNASWDPHLSEASHCILFSLPASVLLCTGKLFVLSASANAKRN